MPTEVINKLTLKRASKYRHASDNFFVTQIAIQEIKRFAAFKFLNYATIPLLLCGSE